jgi:glycosyltransferase involved in cell wall biosynthesis
MNNKVAIIVIGRNEGERLKNCLHSLLNQSQKIVYVDSGSTDSSVAYAESLGIAAVELDMSTPFNAGRARNEGFAQATILWPDIKFVQFIDGDCELEKGWLNFAERHLKENDTWAIVAGRRKERFPEKSIYNLLCDIEWNTLIGKAMACGGDFMIKVEAFRLVNGFNPQVIAGEEPELCYRLRLEGWEIHRLDHPMALHDAALTKFSQWWRRCVRSGHAYAQGVALCGWTLADNNLRQTIRIWIWGAVLPLTIFLLSQMNIPQALSILIVLYSVQAGRIATTMKKRNLSVRESLVYGIFIILGRWPQLLGQLRYWWNTFHNYKLHIIEYK